jgi:peptidoglycan-associated lipoprotein
MMGKDTIHFALDKYTVAPEDMASLQAQAQWLLKYPSKKATIEGHCDERGTREYNLALVNAAPRRPRTTSSRWASMPRA